MTPIARATHPRASSLIEGSGEFSETARTLTAPVVQRALTVTALLATLMPFSSDMYLAHMPELSAELGLDVVGAQLTLTGFLLGVAGGQFGWGVLSDRIGRRRPLLAALTLYAVASMVAATAPTGWVLIVARVMQGLGASAGLVLGRAVARDLVSGKRLARALSWVALAMAFAPVGAPVLGGLLVDHGGWRIVMLALGGFGLAHLALVWFLLPESHARPVRARIRVSALGDARVLRATLVLVLQYGVLFAYLSGSATILRGVYGLEGTMFGLVLAINSVLLTAMALLNTRLVRRIPLTSLVLAASCTALGASAVLILTTTLAGVLPLAAYIALSVVACAPMSTVTANASALALAPHPERAGGVSAVMGGTQFLFAAAVTLLVAPTGTVTPMSTAIVMGACALGAAVSAVLLRQAHAGR